MKPIINYQFQDDFFEGVVARCVKECIQYYSERLVSIYVWGSVHRYEAVRGVSDLDMIVFVSHTEEADRQWRNDWINDQLEKEFPDLAWGLIPHAYHISNAPHNISSDDTPSQQVRNRNGAHQLLHDATLVYGDELTKGLTFPPPGKVEAQSVLNSVLPLARYGAGLTTENHTDFDLPQDLSLKLRKLGRLAVLGGACLLMAQGRFQSYKGTDTLPLLTASYPAWAHFLEHTRSIYISPVDTTTTQVNEYSMELVSWLEWIQEQID